MALDTYSLTSIIDNGVGLEVNSEVPERSKNKFEMTF